MIVGRGVQEDRREPELTLGRRCVKVEAMDRHELEGMATPEQLAAAVKEYRGDLGSLHGPHEHPGEAVREATYKGHHIRIVTQYQIELDGVPITGHVLVTNAGRVHYHAIPN